MKRFLLFGYADYYPNGGWSDFLSSHDDAASARAALAATVNSSSQATSADIVDTVTGEWTELSYNEASRTFEVFRSSRPVEPGQPAGE